MTELSDELLVAYVDGQLAGDQSAAIERVLKYDEVAAERVAALRSAYERMEAAFDSLLDDEHAQLVPEPERQQREPAQPQVQSIAVSVPDKSLLTAIADKNFLALVAGGALAFFLVGGATGYGLSGGSDAVQPETASAESPAPDWRRDAAYAQALMGREALEIGLENQANPELVGFQLANMIGQGAAIPDLESGGLTFKRAQILQYAGQPIAQLLYLPKEGPPVALFAKKAGGDSEDNLSQKYDDVQVVGWTQKGIDYALMAPASESRLRQLAETAKRQLAGQ
jgi:anti-sigma factor RsiW